MTVNGNPLPIGEDPGCFWHGPEPIPADVYRVCFECGHAYRTRAEILDGHREAYRGAFPEDPPLPDGHAETYADQFCPRCVHDW